MAATQLQISLHDSVDKALNKLADSTSEDKVVFTVVMDNIEELGKLKSEGKCHPKEEAMHGRINKIRKLKLYDKEQSVRIYFAVSNGCIHVIDIDFGKRRTDMKKGYEDTLLKRYKQMTGHR